MFLPASDQISSEEIPLINHLAAPQNPRKNVGLRKFRAAPRNAVEWVSISDLALIVNTIKLSARPSDREIYSGRC